MKDIKEIALNLFSLDAEIYCKETPEHHACLFCNKCRDGNEDQLVTDFSTISQYIDHTLLRANATSSDIYQLCDEADSYRFKNVCVNPTFINLLRNYTFPPPICTVIGFPFGANTTETKTFETKNAIVLGVEEIDMVMNIGALKEDSHQYILDEICQIANLCNDNNVLLKVILETCLLTEDEIIKACLIAKKAGACFVKTSTGFSVKGAEVDTVKLMREVVGAKMGVKASGGITTKDEALAMLVAGANRLGTSNSVEIMSTCSGDPEEV